MMKTMITLAAAAVLFAITSNVAEAAKINPNPMAGPSGKNLTLGTLRKRQYPWHSKGSWGTQTLGGNH